MSSKPEANVPVDQDGKKIAYTGVEVYVEVLEKLHVWMRANGMSLVLETDPRITPSRR